MNAITADAITADPAFVPGALPHASTLEFDGKTVIYDEHAHSILVLNASAGELWRRCDGASTIEDIVDDLSAAHSVTRDVVFGDVWHTVNKLAALGLVADARPHAPTA